MASCAGSRTLSWSTFLSFWDDATRKNAEMPSAPFEARLVAFEEIGPPCLALARPSLREEPDTCSCLRHFSNISNLAGRRLEIDQSVFQFAVSAASTSWRLAAASGRSRGTVVGSTSACGCLGGEFCEKLFDRRPIFFGSLWVLVFSECRGSMDTGDLRDELVFFERGRDIENGFGNCNLFWILS